MSIVKSQAQLHVGNSENIYTEKYKPNDLNVLESEGLTARFSVWDKKYSSKHWNTSIFCMVPGI